ncbi:MAG: hypothetical protein QG609_319 [Patescibacteria group bacterium]|nr:hypothetical protein [Patescibacteria group bacterium]
MKNNVIWRNRANAILGIVIAIFPFVEGFPTELEKIILFVLGLLITLFSITGIKMKSQFEVKNQEGLETFFDKNIKNDTDDSYATPLYDVDQK